MPDIQQLKGVFEMGFWNNIGDNVKNTAATVGKKTDETIKASKLKFKSSQLNNDIKNKYEKLGALVYELSKSGEKDSEAFDELIAEIDTAKAELEDISKQLDELKGMVACTVCGFKTDNDNSFCPKCGAKLPERPAPAAEEDVVIEENKDEDVF